jgi:hypothetical protein
MSTRSVPVRISTPQPKRPTSELVKSKPREQSTTALRLGLWTAGIVLAAFQAWTFRYQVTADSISYLDMSDGVFHGYDWHRLINGVWSPLYPFLLGLFRRIFNISAPNEIVAGHLLNVAFFLFAFVCFEFFLQTAIDRLASRTEVLVQVDSQVSFPRWAYLSVGYVLFLWASIDKISLRDLRADMLMSGFVYLAAALLVRMQGRDAHWRDYVVLGVVLGTGLLAKEPLLPIGLLILAASLFAVKNWRPALKMAATALAIFLLIGSLYFVPLSLARGHFTLGESGRYNYLVDVNKARPDWYLQNAGSARGSFVHPPERIFASPPAYAFSLPSLVTHPLRFDPSDWIAGVRPHFILRRQIIRFIPNLRNLGELLFQLGLVVVPVLALAFLSGKRGMFFAALRRGWPIWVIGLTGCAMYLPVHIESRYVAAFLVLFLFGLLISFKAPQNVKRPWLIAGATVVVTGSLMLPLATRIYVRYVEYAGKPNADAQAAAELVLLGIKPTDKVARVSPIVIDLGIERIARTEIVAEVDWEHAQEFWSAPPNTQREILDLFAARGAKAVIATLPKDGPKNSSEWIHLGTTQYWAWLPGTNRLRSR